MWVLVIHHHPSKDIDALCNACVFHNSESFWSSQIPGGKTKTGSAVLSMQLFDGEGHPQTYLTCTRAWGGQLYSRLNYEVLPAVYQAESVCFLNITSVFLISYRTAQAPHFTSLPSSTSTKETTLPELFSKPAGVTCRIHYTRFSEKIERLPCEGNSHSYQTNSCAAHLLDQRGWAGVAAGLEFEMAAIHVFFFSSFFSPCSVGENEARCWSEASGCAALKQSSVAVRASHGWDVPIHSLLESCISMQLPIRLNPSLPILMWATYGASSVHYVSWSIPRPTTNAIFVEQQKIAMFLSVQAVSRCMFGSVGEQSEVTSLHRKPGLRYWEVFTSLRVVWVYIS